METSSKEQPGGKLDGLWNVQQQVNINCSPINNSTIKLIQQRYNDNNGQETIYNNNRMNGRNLNLNISAETGYHNEIQHSHLQTQLDTSNTSIVHPPNLNVHKEFQHSHLQSQLHTGNTPIVHPTNINVHNEIPHSHLQPQLDIFTTSIVQPPMLPNGYGRRVIPYNYIPKNKITKAIAMQHVTSTYTGLAADTQARKQINMMMMIKTCFKEWARAVIERSYVLTATTLTSFQEVIKTHQMTILSFHNVKEAIRKMDINNPIVPRDLYFLKTERFLVLVIITGTENWKHCFVVIMVLHILIRKELKVVLQSSV